MKPSEIIKQRLRNKGYGTDDDQISPFDKEIFIFLDEFYNKYDQDITNISTRFGNIEHK